jgi:hypothetical protein
MTPLRIYPGPYPRLGLVGIAGSGKDTAAHALQELGWRRVAFADQVRRLAAFVDPVVGLSRLSEITDALGWETAKREIPEVRRLLVELGMGVREVIGRDAWLQAGLAVADGLCGPVVFTDVRFPNEAAAMDLLVRIVRPGQGAATNSADESSEGLRVHRTIVNDSTPGTLQSRLLAILQEVAWHPLPSTPAPSPSAFTVASTP